MKAFLVDLLFYQKLILISSLRKVMFKLCRYVRRFEKTDESRYSIRIMCSVCWKNSRILITWNVNSTTLWSYCIMNKILYCKAQKIKNLRARNSSSKWLVSRGSLWGWIAMWNARERRKKVVELLQAQDCHCSKRKSRSNVISNVN